MGRPPDERRRAKCISIWRSHRSVRRRWAPRRPARRRRGRRSPEWIAGRFFGRSGWDRYVDETMEADYEATGNTNSSGHRTMAMKPDAAAADAVLQSMQIIGTNSVSDMLTRIHIYIHMVHIYT